MAARTPVTTASTTQRPHIETELMDLDVDCWVVDRQSPQNSLQTSDSAPDLAQFHTLKPEEIQGKCASEGRKMSEFPMNRGERDRCVESSAVQERNSIGMKSGESLTREKWRENCGYYRESEEILEIWGSGVGNLDIGVSSEERYTKQPPFHPRELEVTSDEFSVESCDLLPHTPTSLRSVYRQRSHIQISTRPPLPVPFTPLTPPASSTASIMDFQRKALLTLNKKRQKTGRKPSSYPCLMCPLSLPYKKELIEHLKAFHGIDRSKSLMYKRLQQGKEELQRLYGGC